MNQNTNTTRYRFGGRNVQKTHNLVLSMLPSLKNGDNFAVVGCKDPKDITQRLKLLGVNVKSEAMETLKLRYIVNVEGNIINTVREKQLNGYIFSRNNVLDYLEQNN